jgi:hypothetical protein
MSKPVVKSSAARPMGRRTAPAKTARKTAKPKATDESSPPLRAKSMLTAGIKALTNAHEEAVARQSRVFESLLGLGQRRVAESASPPIATTLDPFGFKKFEDVFDQRVARALEHIGMPTAEAFAELEAEVERLRETVARLEARKGRG